MKLTVAFITIGILVGGWSNKEYQTTDEESLLLSKWIESIFEKAEIQHTDFAPFEIRDLPNQIEQLGVDEPHVQFGRKFMSFSEFSEVFEEALHEANVEAEAMTEWEDSRHEGTMVHTRVFRIGVKGVVVSFYRPNVIVAGVGEHESSLNRKNQLIEMNQ